MKSLFSILLLLFSTSLIAQNTVCFTVVANPWSSDPALGAFSKYVDVYGFAILAESSVPDEKVLHAAAITAELLDNDEDGTVDDASLLTTLTNASALMPVFSAEGSPGENTFFNNYNGNGVSAVLYQDEMHPAGSSQQDGFDATIEEILHTINHVGHSNLYPNAFSFAPNSSLLSEAMDTARGGQFTNIPNPYPAAAWYHYDDQTCDYECMATEYIYWAISTNMGLQDYPGRCNEIANEWEPCTQALLQSTDTRVYALITDPQYKLPQMAPDGNYCPLANGVEEKTSPAHLLTATPNPSHGTFRLNLDTEAQGTLSILDLSGRLLEQHPLSGMQVLQSKVPAGHYLIRFEQTNQTAAMGRIVVH